MQSSNDLNKNRIGILMGGASTEREISLKSGSAVYEALKNNNYNVIPLDLTTEIEKEVISMIKKADISIAFIALHGRFGEDGTIQKILEDLRIPYTGSGKTASRIAMDKVASRKIFQHHNIPVPKFIVVNKKKEYSLEMIAEALKTLPLVVKPATQGSSVGVSLIHDFQDLDKAVSLAFQFSSKIIIEEYIKGRELTVGILEDKPLPIIEIVPKEKFFDYRAKYQSGKTNYVVPAELPDNITKNVQEIGLRAHKAINCKAFSRIDLILDLENRPVILEINSIPGLTLTSLLPKAASALNIDFSELCLRLIRLALCQKRNKK